jgi:probable phosphoglycerate mutase
VIGELHARAGAGDVPGRRLVLLRHGRTAWNEAGRAQGHADVELDDLGHEQARGVAPYLASLRPDGLWSSDLARARQTAAYVAKETGLTATHDERLREFSVGERQGLTIAEFAARFPAEHAAWVRGDQGVVPGAETTEQVAARMAAALADCLAALGPGGLGVVVTHGASLKVGLVGLLGWPREQAPTLQGLDNCAWVAVEELGHGGRMRLAAYNASVRPGHAAPR